MKFRKAIKSDSAKDFSSLFFSNILQKVFGLIREPIVAFFFGSSLVYANYLLLRTIADFFSQFTVGNALKANLLPKFTKVYQKYKEVSFKKIQAFSRKVMFLLFFVSQIIQFVIIWHLDSDYTILLSIVSILLSLSICFNFLNTIYLTIIQAQAKFFTFSIATTINSFLVTALVYPLTLFFNVFGLVISRLIGILSITITYVVPMNKRIDGYEIPISRRDFNIPTLVLGNFANIIIISSRIVSGLDGGNSITYYTYSVFILNAMLTAIIGNISTLLLRKVSIGRNNRFMLLSILISVIVGLFLVFFLQFFGFDFIKFIFMRGQFNLYDVKNTTMFIEKLSYAFVLIFISTTLFQPFFSLPIESTRKVRRNICVIFLITIGLGFLFSFFADLSVVNESIIMIYTSSFMSLFLSVFSYFYYIKNNK